MGLDFFSGFQLGHIARLIAEWDHIIIRLMFRTCPSRPSHSSSEEDNADSLDEKYGKEKRETYPMAEAKKNPEATGKLLEPSV